MVVDLNVHWTTAGDGEVQPHAHVMLSMRAVDGDGFGKKQRGWNDKALLRDWRERWARGGERAFVRAGVRRAGGSPLVRGAGDRAGAAAQGRVRRGRGGRRGARMRSAVRSTTRLRVQERGADRGGPHGGAGRADAAALDIYQARPGAVGEPAHGWGGAVRHGDGDGGSVAPELVRLGARRPGSGAVQHAGDGGG